MLWPKKCGDSHKWGQSAREGILLRISQSPRWEPCENRSGRVGWHVDCRRFQIPSRFFKQMLCIFSLLYPCAVVYCCTICFVAILTLQPSSGWSFDQLQHLVQRPITWKVGINPMSKRNMIISITQLYSNSLYFSVFADDFEIYRCILHDIAATVLLCIYIYIALRISIWHVLLLWTVIRSDHYHDHYYELLHIYIYILHWE